MKFKNDLVMEMQKQNSGNKMNENKKRYYRLLSMAFLSFILMYFLMYSMVDQFENIISSFDQFYMAVIMTAPMVIIEIILMRSMYMNKKLNIGIIAITAALFVTSFLFIRNQTGVGDKEFMKAMIPHHAAAILMVKETKLKDPEVQKLAHDIITSQQEQIDFMKAKLKELEK